MENIKFMPITTNFASMNNKNNEFIVWHNTGNYNDTPIANRNYFNKQGVNASAHYIIKDNEVIQCVREKDRAFHCGLDNFHRYCKNYNSIGIEVCGSNGEMSKQSLNTLIKLTKELMNKYNIPIENVLLHREVGYTDCPCYINNKLASLLRCELRNESNAKQGQVINVNSGSWLNVRNSKGEVIGKVFPNEIVDILSENADKYYISYHVDNTNNHKQGYVSKLYIKLL